jgi:hypothetical protein
MDTTDTVHQVLERAWNAHASGEFEAALQDYIWLFEQATTTDPEVAPLRLSYVLGGWAKLAEEYLPARRALVETRDRDSQRLLNGESDDDEGDAVLFNDIRSINDKLGDLQNTYHLFQRLPADMARRCARSALPSLMVCGDYALARSHLPEPGQHLAACAAQLNEQLEGLNFLNHDDMSTLLTDVFNYATEVLLVLDLLSGCGDTAGASGERTSVTACDCARRAPACRPNWRRQAPRWTPWSNCRMSRRPNSAGGAGIHSDPIVIQ